jgi:hypothetical protein
MVVAIPLAQTKANFSSGVNGNLTKPNAFVGSGHIIAICSGMSHFSQIYEDTCRLTISLADNA